MSTEFETAATVESVSIRDQMISWLSDYYPKGALNTNQYYLISAFADILTDIDNEVDLTVLDTGIDEARDNALYKNFGELFGLKLKSNLQWGWDDYRFFLKVLMEAFTLYGSTSFGLRRVIQVATGISPYVLEHYKYAGWILGEYVLGATAIVQTGNYVWNTIGDPDLDSYNFMDIFSPQMSEIWVCGFKAGNIAKVYRNTNYSKIWYDYTPALSATAFYGIHGATKQNVWVCGLDNIGFDGIVFKHHYQDGWTEELRNPGARYWDIWMYSDTVGWVVGDGGEVEHLSGGIWTYYQPIVAPIFYGVHGYDNQNVYVVGNSSAVAKWNGAAWLIRSTPGVQHWRGVYTVGPNDVWICGLSGVVGHTTDGGITWSIQTPTAVNLFGIYVSPDGKHIRLCGATGVVLHSIDSGTTWHTETQQSTGVILRSMAVSKNNHMGYICGDTGTVLRNNGQSPGFTLTLKMFSLDPTLITDLNSSILTTSIKTAFTDVGYALTTNAILKVVTASVEWYIIDGDHTFRILNEFLELNVYPPTGVVYDNGELIYGAILESRYGRRNSADVIVWNVKDPDLVQEFITDMKPAHVKVYTIHEWPFILDYYYDYYYEDIYTGETTTHFLEQVNENVTVINGRRYGYEMSRVTYGTDEVNIPQLT